LKNSFSNKATVHKNYFTLSILLRKNKFFTYALLPLLLLAVYSCSISLFPGYRSLNVSDAEMPSSWFKADTGRYLFNTGINVMKNQFSGITVVKPGTEGNYRIVMITQTGLKIMDLEFFDDMEPSVHYILEAMNKKILIRTLAADLGLIFMNQSEPQWYFDERTHSNVAKYKTGDGKRFYYFRSGENHPYQAKYMKGITNKVMARFYGNEQTGLDSVIISHYNLALKVSLYRIHE